MFPSSSNNNGDHFSFTNESMLATSFTENENPSSSQQHQRPSSILHFPDDDQPFLADDNELFMSHFFSQHQSLGCSSNNMVAKADIKMASPVKPTKKTTTRKKKNPGNGEKQAVPRKRTGKKDRHSKIYTAQGPRDRRMRLSLQIARKFFDLQDMLGFDKASKTIEWLFSKSKAAIKELMESFPSVKNSCTGGAKTFSSTSESEVVSGIKDTGDQKSTLAVADSLVGIPSAAMNRKSRKPIINSTVREYREKARARARERTMEKMGMKGLEKSKKCSEEANPNDLKVAAVEKESCMIHLPENEMVSVSIIEKLLGITNSPRSSSIFDYTLNIGESSVASSQQNHPVYNDYNSYCAMTNVKGSTGNRREQNPGEVFNISLDTQEQESRSIYMSTGVNPHDQNPSSDFKVLSNAPEQNPSSIVMTTSNIDSHSQAHFREYQLSCNPIVDNRYCSLY